MAISTGAPSIYCPRCRQPLDPGAQACPYCGQNLNSRTGYVEPPTAIGRTADVVFGTVAGFLSAGLMPLFAVLLVIATRSAGSGPGSWHTARMAVWGFICIPPAVYISLMSSLGASTSWTGVPKGRLFGMAADRGLLGRLSPDQITLGISSRCGAIGGMVGFGSLTVLIAAWLVISVAMVFLGPGPPILLLTMVAIVASLAVCAAWGAVIGALIFVRRRYGWPAGLALATTVVTLLNFIISWVV